jgi:hypothetical protein
MKQTLQLFVFAFLFGFYGCIEKSSEQNRNKADFFVGTYLNSTLDSAYNNVYHVSKVVISKKDASAIVISVSTFDGHDFILNNAKINSASASGSSAALDEVTTINGYGSCPFIISGKLNINSSNEIQLLSDGYIKDSTCSNGYSNGTFYFFQGYKQL